MKTVLIRWAGWYFINWVSLVTPNKCRTPVIYNLKGYDTKSHQPPTVSGSTLWNNFITAWILHVACTIAVRVCWDFFPPVVIPLCICLMFSLLQHRFQFGRHILVFFSNIQFCAQAVQIQSTRANCALMKDNWVSILFHPCYLWCICCSYNYRKRGIVHHNYK